MTNEKLKTIGLYLLSIGIFIHIIALAYPCSQGDCGLRKLFGFIPNNIITTALVSLAGVIAFVWLLTILWGNEFKSNLKKYTINGLFLLGTISIIDKYVIPVIALSFQSSLYELFRWSILLVGLCVMMLFWMLRDWLRTEL